MRRVLPIVVFCLLAASFTGCKKAKLRMQLKELMSATIVLPERVSMVYNGVISTMPDSLRAVPKLIVYVDSSECTTCWISHIRTYHGVLQLSKEKGTFEVILLLPNVDLNGIAVTRYISDLELEIPVYVDVDNGFLSLNPAVPKDRRMHSFLLDRTGSPLCVGDPASSEKMFQVFLKSLEYL